MANDCGCPEELHVNRAGLRLRVNLKHCVDGETVPRPLIVGDIARMYVKPVRNADAPKELVGAIIEDAELGIVSSLTAIDTLDAVGIWKVWASIERDGNLFPSKASEFMVYEN